MNLSWHVRKPDLIECRWSQVGDRLPYNPSWSHPNPDTPAVNLAGNPILDLTIISPFGAGDWYALQRTKRA